MSPDDSATAQELVQLLDERGEAEPLIPYSCHICGLCQAVCPQGLHAGRACLEFRERLVAAGQAPLPQHKGIQNYVHWGTHPIFALSRPDPSSGRARRVFFPGCALSGHSPHLVKAAYAYLRQRLPDTGIILNCCGAPSQLLGERQVLERVAGGVAAELAKLGATELIAACTHCLHTIRDFLPGIKTRSIYEVMAETGLPPGLARGEKAVFNLQDACGARQSPEIHEAVRHLVQAAGHGLRRDGPYPGTQPLLRLRRHGARGGPRAGPAADRGSPGRSQIRPAHLLRRLPGPVCRGGPALAPLAGADLQPRLARGQVHSPSQFPDPLAAPLAFEEALPKFMRPLTT